MLPSQNRVMYFHAWMVSTVPRTNFVSATRVPASATTNNRAKDRMITRVSGARARVTRKGQ